MHGIDALLTDIRGALRSLRRAPAFFLVPVLVLAVAIGMATAIVTAFHAVALSGLPIPDHDRVVRLYAEDPSRGFDHVPLTHAMFEEFARASGTLESAGGVQYAGAWPNDFLDGDRHVRAPGVLVTGAFFETLGRPAALGRALEPADYETGSEPVIVIGHDLWQRDFGGDPSVIGRRLRFVRGDDLDLTIVGVMPDGFDLPGNAEWWIPLGRLYQEHAESLERIGIDVIGRLAPGRTIATAQQELGAYLASQTLSTSDAYRTVRPVGYTLIEAQVGDIRPILFVISAAATLLLLVACFNVTTLFLMRGSRRRHELAVRAALGASTARVARQVAVEAALVAVLGGGAGLLLVDPILRVFTALAPAGLPRLASIEPGTPAVLIGVGTTAIVAVLAGVVPAFTTAGSLRRDGARAGSGARTSSDRRAVGVRRGLVAVQFGLAMLVLSAASLVIQSLSRLPALDPGFDPHGVVHVQLAGPLDRLGPAEATRRVFDRLIPALEARPQIESATAINIGPFSGTGGYDGRYVAEGQTLEDAASNPWLNFDIVSPSYFEVFGIAPVSGRTLDGGDVDGAPLVAVLSAGAAESLWPGQDAIGRRIRTTSEGSSWYTVVGTIADTRYREYREPRPSVYFAAAQSPYDNFHPSQLAVRAAGPTGEAASAVRDVVAEIEPEVLVTVVEPFEDLMETPLAQPRLNALLLASFAGSALLLAGVGLYAVLAFAVRQRGREMGIRRAVGATGMDIAREVLREGLLVAVIGVSGGLVLALALGGTLGTVVFGIRPGDPITLGAVFGFLISVAAGACLLPARQAARSDPNALLRTE
ncbi:MAG: ABC transporter permease [Gemmatimonadota bacterium]|nr:ABC transporter permease [Gemmatimonadota bacterium]